MFNKLSTKTLIILFSVLLLIVVAFLLYDSQHGERSFRSEIISIDTSKVTSINIYPKQNNHKLVKIFKDGNYWKVNLDNNKTADVPHQKVENIFRELLNIKPLSVAALGKNKWKEFQVDDTSGTKIKIFENGNNTLDLTIGKFAFQRPKSIFTYVRVGDDENVYKINGMPGFTLNQDVNYFRDGRIVNDNFSNWSKLNFTYPADSSFVLEKKNKNWMADNRVVDSAEVSNYLRTLSNLANQNFIDNFDKSNFKKALYTLTINSSSKGGITIAAYKVNNEYILHSSTNPDAYFDASKNDLLIKIFVGKRKFYNKK